MAAIKYYRNKIDQKNIIGQARFKPDEKLKGLYDGKFDDDLKQVPTPLMAPNLSFDDDIHFGLNFKVEPDLPTGLKPKLNVLGDNTPIDLSIYGNRYYHMAMYGGRIAEYAWSVSDNRNDYAKIEYKMHNSVKKEFNSGLSETILKELYENINWAPGKNIYPNNSFLSGSPKTGTRFPKANMYEGVNGINKGTLWSKAALLYALVKEDKIHFHLDGMQNIANILAKRKINEPDKMDGFEYSYNVTSRELRFVVRHYELFANHITFYNGYEKNDRNKIVPIKLEEATFKMLHTFYRNIHKKNFRNEKKHKTYKKWVENKGKHVII